MSNLKDGDAIRCELKKAIKSGKTECAKIADGINKFIDGELWGDLNLPGKTDSDKLHNFVTLPFDQGGLNCKIDELEALLGLNKAVLRKFRNLAYQAKPGERTDLKKKEGKVSTGSKSKKAAPKKRSNSQRANDRAVERAAQAVPALDNLINEGLVPVKDVAKLGKEVKDRENPTPAEKKIMEQQKQVQQELAKIVPDEMPTEPQAKKELKEKVKAAIAKVAPTVSKPKKVMIGDNSQSVAKEIAEAAQSLEFLQDLVYCLNLEIEDLVKAKSQAGDAFTKTEMPLAA